MMGKPQSKYINNDDNHDYYYHDYYKDEEEDTLMSTVPSSGSSRGSFCCSSASRSGVSSSSLSSSSSSSSSRSCCFAFCQPSKQKVRNQQKKRRQQQQQHCQPAAARRRKTRQPFALHSMTAESLSLIDMVRSIMSIRRKEPERYLANKIPIVVAEQDEEDYRHVRITMRKYAHVIVEEEEEEEAEFDSDDCSSVPSEYRDTMRMEAEEDYSDTLLPIGYSQVSTKRNTTPALTWSSCSATTYSGS